MGDVPGSGVVRRKRRRRVVEPKGWKAVPNPAKILMLTCLAVLVLSQLALQNGWIRRKHDDTIISQPAGPSVLIIREATFDRTSRRIKGVVTNTSANSYKDVQVSYNVRDAGGIEVGTILGFIPGIGPKQSANFETDLLPPNSREFILREVVGTVR